MTTFALVPGAGHGPWCWARVVPLLIAAGHRAVLPELPTEDSTAGAVRYAEIVGAALEGSGDDVILVGHSLGGLTVPLVAAARRVRHVVYLSALLPRPGRLPFEPDPAAPPDSAPGLRVVRFEHGLFAFPPDVARSHLYNRCSPTDADWAIAQLRRQSTAPHVEVCPLKELPATPATYIAATDDRTVTPEHGAYLSRTRLGREPLTIDADHSAFLSAPQTLASLLQRIAIAR